MITCKFDHAGEFTASHAIEPLPKTLGEKRKALDSFNEALPLIRAIGDRAYEAATLLNVGRIHDDSGEAQEALDFYNQALPLFRALGDKSGEAITTNKIGFIYDDLGETQKALNYLNQSLPLLSVLGDKKREANTLNKIGLIYSDLGELLKAFYLFDQAMKISRASGDKEGEAVTLNNLGNLYNTVSTQKALGFYLESLPLLRAVGDRWSEALMLNNIGRVYHDMGETQKAFDSFNDSLRLIRAEGDKRYEAVTLTNIGGLYDTLGEKQKSSDFYNQALTIFRAVGDRRYEAVTLGNIAGLERDRGNLLEARKNVKAAIDLIESLRGKIINQELRSSYFASMQVYYEFYIDVLMRLHAQHPNEGHDGEALQVSEQARARVLLETLAEANADIRQGVDPHLVERERALQQQLNTSALRQIQLLSGPRHREQAADAAKEIESLTTEFQQVEAQIRETSPRYAALTQPQPLDSKEIQAQLDPNTLLLEYTLGTEHSYLWLVSSTTIQTFELPARKQVETAAGTFIEVLKTDTRIYGGINQNPPVATGIVDAQQREMLDSALRLSQMLLGPAASQLGQKRLVIVGDGILLKLPFAALPDIASAKQGIANMQPLILRNEIVNLPSASALNRST